MKENRLTPLNYFNAVVVGAAFGVLGGAWFSSLFSYLPVTILAGLTFFGVAFGVTLIVSRDGIEGLLGLFAVFFN